MSIPLNTLKIWLRFLKQHGRRFAGEQFRESRRKIAASPFQIDFSKWSNDRLTVAWIGHATVLINMFGTWFLTDPALGSHVGLNIGPITIGPRRLFAPAVTIRQLPKLDAILVSHSHMDHCDMGTLRRLSSNNTIVAQKNNRDLYARFQTVYDLSWGDSVEIGGATVESIEVNHWGARKLTDHHRGYGGFLIQKNGHAVVFGGDTADTRAFAGLKLRTKIDLACMPIGGYDPYIHAHANPEQSWKMAREMGAEYILPMHHSTFRLSREPVDDPIKRLLAVAGDEAWRIALTTPGQTWQLNQETAQASDVPDRASEAA